jgi:metallophosphoesterase (TIGR00282 family)
MAMRVTLRCVRILFIGDVVGSPGRSVVQGMLPALVDSERPDFVVVNGENSAGGLGITPKTAQALFSAGADGITLGNHSFHRRDAYEMLDHDERIVRPANYPKAAPGRGQTVIEKNGMRLGLVNLSGQFSLDVARSPFAEVDAVLAAMDTTHVLVDFHAEATSEKVAMGWHLDGRVTALVGTHTHIPTDARVLPGGTAYVTDVGMTGARGGVIGMRREQALTKFLTQLPARFEPSDDDPWLNAVVIDSDDAGVATGIRQILLPYSPSSAASNGGVNQTM